MKKTNVFFTLISCLFIGFYAGSQCSPTATPLSTSYNQNNGQRGVMFNVNATNTITISCFDANLYSGTTADYEIYYKSGSYVGSENNSAAWTLIGSTTGLTSLGNNVATPIPIPVNITVPGGSTYAFYITNTYGGGTSYTDGTGANTTLASNADFSITGGVGKSYPFGLTFSYRNFNGTAYYVPGIPLPVELSNFWATPEGRKVRLNWLTASEHNNDYFLIERSEDGNSWETIAKVEGAGTTTDAHHYMIHDEEPLEGISYYRLSQVDFDGSSETFTVKSVDRTAITPVLINKIYPNPSNGQFRINLEKDEQEDIALCDLLGRDLFKSGEASYLIEGGNELVFSIQSPFKGIAILKVGNATQKIVIQ